VEEGENLDAAVEEADWLHLGGVVLRVLSDAIILLSGPALKDTPAVEAVLPEVADSVIRKVREREVKGCVLTV
jgi:hypothetical protein